MNTFLFYIPERIDNMLLDPHTKCQVLPGLRVFPEHELLRISLLAGGFSRLTAYFPAEESVFRPCYVL